MFSTRLMNPDAAGGGDPPVEEESLKKHGDKLDPDKLGGISKAAMEGADEADANVAPRSSVMGDTEAQKRDAVSRQR